MLRYFIIAFIIIRNINLLQGQQLFQNVYKKTTGGAMSVTAFDNSTNGSHYIIGDGFTNANQVIIKIDSNGNVAWNKSYTDSAGFVGLLTLVATTDGGFAAAGYCTSGFLLVRRSPLGLTEWNLLLCTLFIRSTVKYCWKVCHPVSFLDLS